MFYTITEISEIISGKLFLTKNYHINSLHIDSRIFTPNENSLFFAISGKIHDGHSYIEFLYNEGCKNFIIEKEHNIKKYTNANFILVENSIKSLQKLASFHRLSSDIQTLAITGSNGKTIVKEWISQILNTKTQLVKNPKSYNSQIGVPLSIMNIEKEHKIGIFEAGISQINEMENLHKIILPTFGIFTNIGDAHQENFETIKQKINEKLKLFYSCKILFYCSDYKDLDEEIKNNQNLKSTKIITWGKTDAATFKIVEITSKNTTTTIEIHKKSINYKIKIPFTDNASIENAIHTFVFIDTVFPEFQIINDFNNLSAVEMRMEIKKGINNCTIINDSYSSDILSLKIALEQLNILNQHNKKTVILSDIQEVNKNYYNTYLEISNLLFKHNVKRLIGVGKNISNFRHLFKLEAYYFSDTKSFLQNIKEIKFRNEDILIKGARIFKFEQIINFLQEKNHRTVLEINLESLVENLNFFRSLLKPETKIMVMVKAFSYGNGTYEIANVLQNQRVDYLGVAVADEGVELRKNGISLPIIIMNPENESFDKMIENKLEPEIYSFSLLEQFNKIIETNNIKHYPIHLKLDTGMYRLGFLESEIDLLNKKLKHFPNLKIQSIFSHLVGSSDVEHKDFTKFQIDLFKNMSDKIIENLDYQPIRHILNSGGIENWASAQFEMVRLGIGLYGISTNNQNKLKNISKLKTTISQIKKVKKGETVGYSRKGLMEKDSQIAIIPIGYADGLNRKLSNKVGFVQLKNKLVPIVGNICMDLTMIDITGIDATEGDEIIIFGDMISVSEIAEKIDTIPYEVLTAISQRVKRIYFK